MGSNLEAINSAIKKADAEREKIIKEWKAAKTPQEKEKLKKMAEGIRKMILAHLDQVDAAKAKDRAAMDNTFKEMGIH